MNLHKLRLLGATLPLLVLAACAVAQKDKKEQRPTLRGLVTAVDSSKRTITLAVRSEGKKVENRTLSLATGVKVLLEEVFDKKQALPEGKLADVTPGTEVTLQLEADKKTVAGIVARGPTLHGQVKFVDASRGTIKVSWKESQGVTEKTFALAKKGKILLNDGLSKTDRDREGKLADLAEGTLVLVSVSVDRKTVLNIRILGQTIQGELKGIDNGSQTVAVTLKEDGQAVDREFPLVKGATVQAGLVQGDKVTVRLSVFDKTKAAAVIKRVGGKDKQ